MYPQLLIAMLLNPFRPCEGSPTFEDKYRVGFVPERARTTNGLQILAPNTPYVAAAGHNKLYFIDTRFDPDTAAHIKQQIEKATVPEPDEYISLDEVTATAELRNSITNATTFVFDPPYARVLFAKGLNRHNPDLQLPEHEPAGDWLVTYDLDDALSQREPLTCAEYACSGNQDCIRQTHGNCKICHHYRVDDECDMPLTNALGICHPMCSRAVDGPRLDGETVASFHKRMDEEHWKKIG